MFVRLHQGGEAAGVSGREGLCPRLPRHRAERSSSVPATAAFCCRDSNHEVKAGLVPEWASCMIQPGEHSDSEPRLLSSGCKQTEQGGFHGTPGLLEEAAPSS